MKIAMMTNNYKPFVAGVPISIERLTETLRKQGHQVVVFAPEYSGVGEEKDVVRYHSLLRNVAGGFSVPDSFDPAIEKKFREGAFDLIHVHQPMMIGSTARYLSRKYHVPLVFTYHTRYEQYLHYIRLSMLKRAVPSYIRHCTEDCDTVIAPTPQMKRHLENTGVRTAVEVLPTGIAEDSFYPDQKKAADIREGLAGDKRYLFCCVARLAKEKNIDFLIRSMKLRKECSGSDFKLVLIGEGPERAHLEKLSGTLGMQEEIVFAGAVSNEEIKNYCHAADLFLFASQSETQGIVLIESMAAGTPVLAVKATGTEDVVKNGVNGYMTELSETEFAGKLMDILEKKEPEILRTGAVSTAWEYECEEIGKKAAGIYREAVKIREEKERMKYYNRKNRRNIIYSQG